MDERHWWIATKVYETFGIGGGSEGNPDVLEDFVRDERVYNMIGQFLAARGPCRLFFYCNKSADGNSVSGRTVHAVDSLAAIKDTKLEDLCVLYMFRTNADTEVDASCIEKEIICGELKGNLIGNMTNILTEVYGSLFKAKSQWGKCSRESQSSLFHSLDKAVNSLSEAGVGSHHSKQAVRTQNMFDNKLLISHTSLVLFTCYCYAK
jgi:dynein heavy chain